MCLACFHGFIIYKESPVWTAVGLIGNAIFGSRFLIQWLHSEKHKKIIVPPIFWQMSFWGSLLALFYAFHIDKLPVILGAVALPFIYSRNIVLQRRQVAA
ncbi:lipid-A-disaccharide synthase N-terminal domain-containing protein [Solilutibacter silvestris]|uniref:lipid-A-disaccharide synthase N-terminal domain-containing protein n=1 Tax=Solilutibacter silvestris TaxID=1645665 RepID=UPI003D33F541